MLANSCHFQIQHPGKYDHHVTTASWSGYEREHSRLHQSPAGITLPCHDCTDLVQALSLPQCSYPHLKLSPTETKSQIHLISFSFQSWKHPHWLTNSQRMYMWKHSNCPWGGRELAQGSGLYSVWESISKWVMSRGKPDVLVGHTFQSNRGGGGERTKLIWLPSSLFRYEREWIFKTMMHARLGCISWTYLHIPFPVYLLQWWIQNSAKGRNTRADTAYEFTKGDHRVRLRDHLWQIHILYLRSKKKQQIECKGGGQQIEGAYAGYVLWWICPEFDTARANTQEFTSWPRVLATWVTTVLTLLSKFVLY